MSKAQFNFFALYATCDVRSLALGRIALALVLLQDLVLRAANLTTFYSNDGLLPNHTVLWRPTADHVFSPFFMASQPYEAAVLFAFCGVAYLMLLFGCRTKLAQVCSWLCVVGLHGRALFLQNGGDAVLGLVALWTAFLPTGRCFSIDALAARLRGQVLASDERQVRSLAVTALLLQLSAIYLLNAIHKDGVTWQQGTVVHYVLHQDRIVTWLGWWVRQHMTLGLSQALTWTALGLEWAIPLALLLPFRVQASRTLAVGLVFALHIGFGLFLNLGVFVPVMLAFAVHLLPSGFWSILPAQRSLNRIGYKLLAKHGVRLLTWSSALGLLRATTPTLRGSWSMLRERMVLALMIYSAGQLFTDNRVFRRFANWHQPGWSRMVTDYLQLHQGWGMFAPEAPTEDFNVVVDAVTEDGRHVDPFNEAASPGARVPGFASPHVLGQNWMFCDYVVGIATRGAYHQAFSEWVQRYPERTGKPRDRIVSFEAHVITDDSPPPGQLYPRNVRRASFLRWPEPPPPSPPKGTALAAMLFT